MANSEASDDEPWHIRFMADEENLSRLWEQATCLDDPDEREHSEDQLRAQWEFLQRTWPVETDIESIARYAARVREFTGNDPDGCGTMARRFADYVPLLVARVRELEAKLEVALLACEMAREPVWTPTEATTGEEGRG